MVSFTTSLLGKFTLASIVIYCITLTLLETLVIMFHLEFVSKFILTQNGNGISESDLIYHAIFITSLVFQVILCLDALIHKNIIQLKALIAFNILSLAYAAVQIYQHIILEEEGTNEAIFSPDDETKFPTPEFTKNYFIKKMRPIEYIIAGLVSGYSIFLGYLSYKLMGEFGWENYKLYSGDLQIRNALVSLTLLHTLIKLDAFFILSYALQLLPSKSIGYSDSIFETVSIFIGGFIIMSMAWYSVSKEMKYLLLFVINLSIFSSIYMVYRIVKILISRSGEMDPYKFTRKLLLFTLITTFVLVCVTIYYAIISFKNMNRGVYVFTAYQSSAIPQDVGDRTSKRFSKIAEVTVARRSSINLD
ncbi:18349_t:CDS:2 [Funneliformis geosporum]|uniref:8388_t:CDS:1 n=1 Tax=Funneliformis geosporum TaxID=1117311 RepID=A0A9W4WQS4_9GLOM|nr:8388_t:CDS:2 [Funneliformis geosporum]CAI2165969.1 18349_t:CDS:2 [Funneliformis geosporum]